MQRKKVLGTFGAGNKGLTTSPPAQQWPSPYRGRGGTAEGGTHFLKKAPPPPRGTVDPALRKGLVHLQGCLSRTARTAC